MSLDYQHIWNQIIPWYEKEHRDLEWRQDRDPYHIWISEIMLQQTRVEAVKGYYRRFMNELPAVDFLANVDDDKLMKLWEGLGYYNRARNLKKAAQTILYEYNGIFPREYEQILSLSGIGKYTAGAISSICFNEPIPAVDGNVLRVLTRLEDWYAVIDDESTKKEAIQKLIPLYELGECGKITQALMELGAMVCIPNGTPHCEQCPLKDECKARIFSHISELPVRKKKKERTVEDKTVFIIQCDGKYGIRKRIEKGVLNGMWEFFNVNAFMDTQQAMDFVSVNGYQPLHIIQKESYKHIFTHKEWRMTAYYLTCQNPLEELCWVEREDLLSNYALPTAFKVFLDREMQDELS